MAGGPKTCLALSMPITNAASETSNMNGHMMRVSKIVSAVLSGDQLHHVKRSTSCGANTMPSSVTTLMKTAVSVATLFARRHADSSPSTAIFFENVVMNAVDNAPSANKSRSRFGNRNAIKNASRFFPAPKRPANTISRINPSRRLDRIAMPTTPAARVLPRRSSTAVIGEQRTASDDLRKQKLQKKLFYPQITRIDANPYREDFSARAPKLKARLAAAREARVLPQFETRNVSAKLVGAIDLNRLRPLQGVLAGRGEPNPIIRWS